MRCQVKPSKSATGLGTLGLWGSPTWKSVTTRAADAGQLLDYPSTCQLTCVWKREAWIRSPRDAHGSFLYLPFSVLLVLHGPTPRQGMDFMSLLRNSLMTLGEFPSTTCPYSLLFPPLCSLCEAGPPGAGSTWQPLGMTSGCGLVLGQLHKL